jgi:transposase
MGLWIRCGNENEVFTIGWKKFAETEKGAAGQVERESHVDGFFYIKGVMHHEFLHQGQTMNRWYYLEVLKRLTENVRRKRPQLWRNNSWFLYHDNAPVHASLLICDFLANTNTTVLPQPPYSPDLAPADIFLFPKLKSTLKGHDFRRFKKLQKIRRWSYAQSRNRHTRIVFRSGNIVGSGASMQQRSTLKAIRLTHMQAHPKNL